MNTVKSLKTYHSKSSVTDLLEMAKLGDQRAYTELYNRYRPFIYFQIKDIVKDSEIAKEILQDVFVKALMNPDMYREDKSFGAWLKKIAINKAIDHVRKVEEQLVSIDADNGVSNKNLSDHDISNEIIKKSNIKALYESVEKLKWKDRRIFKMRYIDDMKYEEIAENLGVNVGTVKSYLHNVKTKLIKLNNVA